MRTDQLDYELPAELVAQDPAAVRSDSRLLVLDRSTGALTDSRFRSPRRIPAGRRLPGPERHQGAAGAVLRPPSDRRQARGPVPPRRHGTRVPHVIASEAKQSQPPGSRRSSRLLAQMARCSRLGGHAQGRPQGEAGGVHRYRRQGATGLLLAKVIEKRPMAFASWRSRRRRMPRPC